MHQPAGGFYSKIWVMIEITKGLSIPEREISLEFIRASGPGGQKVNKTSTAVQLRFDVLNSASLPEDVRARLIQLAGKRITTDGVLIIEASRYRTQESNRQDAIDRFVELLRKATEEPKQRQETQPTAASKSQRLQEKKIKSEKKRLRKRVDLEDW